LIKSIKTQIQDPWAQRAKEQKEKKRKETTRHTEKTVPRTVGQYAHAQIKVRKDNRITTVGHKKQIQKKETTF